MIWIPLIGLPIVAVILLVSTLALAFSEDVEGSGAACVILVLCTLVVATSWMIHLAGGVQ